MPAFFIVLFKINLGLALFAIAYYLILRRLTFYTLNRAFLIFGILFSTAYPFINLTDLFHNQKKIINFVPDINQVKALVAPDTIAAYWTWISILFWTGVTIMAARLIIQFVSLRQLHKRSTPGFIDNLPVRMLDEPVSPFSFWRNIYINPNLHRTIELNNILAHEIVHVKEWHTLDIILAELSVVFYWFNPGVWLMKKAVKETLEFITDEKVLKEGIDKKTYQYSLLEVGNLKHYAPIANSFTLADLKKRIKMMNVKRSSRLTLSRYFLVLPVLLLITLAFTISEKETKKVLQPFTEVLVPTVNTPTNTIENPTVQTEQPVKAKARRSITSSPKINAVTGIQIPQENPPTGTIPGSADSSALANNFDDPSVKTVIGRRSVKGVNLDTAKPATPPNPASIVDENVLNEKPVITVIGYPSPKRTTQNTTEATNKRVEGLPLPGNDSLTTKNAPAAKDNPEEKPYKVVTGYRSPRAADKPKN